MAIAKGCLRLYLTWVRSERRQQTTGKTFISHTRHRVENETTLKMTFDLRQDDFLNYANRQKGTRK